MIDYIEIGPTPADEHCQQVGTPEYSSVLAYAECQHFIKAIRLVCGPEPEGAKLTITNNPHDFGSYYEVAVKYDTDIPDAVEYAYHVDSNAPLTWPEGI